MERYIVWFVLIGIYICSSLVGFYGSSPIQCIVFMAVILGSFLTLRVSKSENFSNFGLSIFCFATVVVMILGIIFGNVLNNLI